MGLYNRARPGKQANWWISYAVSKELAQRFGVARDVREPAGHDRREAERLLARRRKEVKDGVWRPHGHASGAMSLEAYALQWLGSREEKGVKGVRAERQHLEDYVIPALGHKALAEVKRSDVKDFVASLDGVISERTNEQLAPRTRRGIYSTLRTMYADAVADEIVIASPCTLKQKRGELPKKRDKDPRWRAGAVFTREEAEMLISDERISEPRRVLYALVLLGGMRIGEAVARRWRDYDHVAKPLGRLVIATQHDEDELKTEEPREMPVHPTLAAVLAGWRLNGFMLHFGHRPGLEDFIVPNKAKTRDARLPVCGKRAWMNLQRDLARLGLRPRRLHDTRRTFISLALADGANDYLLRFVTHGRPSESAFDAYAQPPWAALCEQVSKLQLSVRAGKLVAFTSQNTSRSRKSAVSEA